MSRKKKIAVLTGAGISAESGIRTFRETGGLWEDHDVMEVASFAGWVKNQELVLNFYNERRRQLKKVNPNDGHTELVKLEEEYDVTVITQNVDNLHERAGSSNIIHLHGELTKVRSTTHDHLIYEWEKDLNIGDKCEMGSQLRPHIVWFGEMVPMLDPASRIVEQTDVAIIVGTSMQVYPAAGLIAYASSGIPIYYVDPNPSINYELRSIKNLKVIQEPATTGVKKVVEELI
ncbi:MAG: Sir2 family NAD-dependent protein deacetylase [Bacteroidota bacterium]